MPGIFAISNVVIFCNLATWNVYINNYYLSWILCEKNNDLSNEFVLAK